MANKYIKEVEFKLTSDESKIYKLNFKPGVNVIIGPKGGGKSTLLNIIHALNSNMKPNKNCIETIKANGFEINLLKYSNDEQILYSKSLNAYNKDNCDNLISQNDEIKTSLHETNQIKNDKERFLNSLLSNLSLMNNWFVNYFNTFININSALNSKANWTLIFQSFHVENNTKAALFKLMKNQDFNIYDKKEKINNQNLITLLTIYIDLLKQTDLNLFEKHQNVFDELINYHQFQLQNSVNNFSIVHSFNESLKRINESIEKSDDKNENVLRNRREVEEMFETLAVNLATNLAHFNFFGSGRINLHFNGESKSEFDLVLSINKEIKLSNVSDEDDEYWITPILEKILYSTSDKKTHWSNWINKSIISDKPIKSSVNANDITNKINEIFSKKIEDHIQLLADGKDYTKMSFGTRTSYGLRHKLKNFSNNIIFMDQPEDNLDNSTIFREIRVLLNKDSNKNIEQIFLVTHNGNLGALTNPSTITTCNLTEKDFEKSYVQNFDVTEKINIDENINDSPVLHYLEGGEESLIEREKTLIKKG